MTYAPLKVCTSSEKEKESIHISYALHQNQWC